MKNMPARLLCLLAFTFVYINAHAEPDNSVNFGMGGFVRAMPHCNAKVYLIEYERAYGDSASVLLRASGVPYRFDNMNYQENGRIKGFDLGARHYYGGRMAGWYTGASLGYWQSDWSFMHLATPGLPQGTASSHSTRLHLELGDRIAIGSGISLMPQVNIGKFFSSSNCTYTGPASAIGIPCNQKSEVDGYFFIGVLAGVAF